MEPTGYPELDALLPRLAVVGTLGPEALDAERIAILGRKQGALTALLKTLPDLEPDRRKSFGAAVNRVKQAFEAAFDQPAGGTTGSLRSQPLHWLITHLSNPMVTVSEVAYLAGRWTAVKRIH